MILWVVLLIVGTIVGAWYQTILAHPWGRLNWPEVLRSSSGHWVCGGAFALGWVSAFALFGWWGSGIRL